MAATDTGATMSAVVCLGLIVILANLLVPGPAWTNFVASAEAFPTFDNPYALTTKTLTLSVEGNGTIEPSTTNVVPVGDSPKDGCYNSVNPETAGDGQWWKCVSADDGNATSATMSSGGGNSCHGVPWCTPGYFMTVNLSAIPASINPSFRILAIDGAITVNFVCQRGGLAESGVVQFFAYRYGSDISSDPALPGSEFMDPGDECPYGQDGVSGPTNFTLEHAKDFNIVGPLEVSGDLIGNWSRAQLVAQLSDSPESVEISYISVTLTYLDDPTAGAGCNPSDFFYYFCEFDLILSAGLQLAILVLNGALFILEIFIWMGGLILAFFGLFGVLFSLGAPSPYQEIIDVAVIAMLVFIIYGFAKSIRGTGGGGI